MERLLGQVLMLGDGTQHLKVEPMSYLVTQLPGLMMSEMAHWKLRNPRLGA